MKKAILIGLEIIFIIVIVISAREIYIWWMENQQNKSILAEIEDAVTVMEQPVKPNETDENTASTEKVYSVDFSKLTSKNNETVGWLKVEGTEVQYPVVQHNDNEFYLTHSLNKSYNKAGWIFMDYRNKNDGTDKNMIIYGHNRRDGSMFSSLKNILKKEWYDNENNKFITFITENGTNIYEVFSAYQVKDEDYYITTNFKNNEFETWIKKMKSRSVKDFGVEVTKDDKVLTLSTCADNNDYRIVLQAVKRGA